MATEVDLRVGDDQILATSEEVVDSLHHVEVSDPAGQGITVPTRLLHCVSRPTSTRSHIGRVSRDMVFTPVKGFPCNIALPAWAGLRPVSYRSMNTS